MTDLVAGIHSMKASDAINYRELTLASAKENLWHFVGLSYGNNWCENCGHYIVWNYHITNEDGTQQIVGSECVKNLINWSHAYREYLSFRKKVDLLFKLRGLKGAERKKCRVEMKEVDALIKEERKRGEETQAARKAELLKPYECIRDLNNGFTQSIFERDYPPTEKQLAVLERIKQEALAKHGTPEAAQKAADEKSVDIRAAIEAKWLVMSGELKMWVTVSDFIKSIGEQAEEKKWLSDKQVTALVNVLTRHQPQLDKVPLEHKTSIVEMLEKHKTGAEQCAETAQPSAAKEV